jgi:hypothetical protein
MIWVKRTFPREGWYHVQDRFEEQFGARGEPQDMMLLFADRSDYQTDIFVGLPDESLLSRYEGFQPIAEGDLPGRVRLLWGDENEFNRRFRSSVA